ncbi:MAG: DUF2147 domain-containing protein [Pseudomonadota bacterium]
MKKFLAAALCALAAPLVLAQGSPVGLWKTIDDKTGKERSLVRISDGGGALVGRIEKRLDPAGKPDARCDTCADDRKDRPVDGLEIIRGARADGEAWTGGTILDPEDGKVYRLRLKVEEAGRKLEVRGYLGPFYRNQHWIRVE